MNHPKSGIRLLTYNVQTGFAAGSYAEYVTRGWQHIFPNRTRLRTLENIGHALRDFDIVGLQEVDRGSFRTGDINLTQVLASTGQFTHWYDQVNRQVGPLAACGNGLLSRQAAVAIEHHALPGIPGRGTLVATFANALVIGVVHLALDRISRRRQLDFLCERFRHEPRAIVMGDFNCASDDHDLKRFLIGACMTPAGSAEPTFPTWRPRAALDHILVSRDIEVEVASELHWRYSDHLPRSATVRCQSIAHPTAA
ncbi:MAG: endonuclease/exonuclease/phosphatase family protein [Pseudomonadota bacterium]